jgi:hypothetical protein
MFHYALDFFLVPQRQPPLLGTSLLVCKIQMLEYNHIRLMPNLRSL